MAIGRVTATFFQRRQFPQSQNTENGRIIRYSRVLVNDCV
uniref:Uncharacterized protein n=1 Tax=Utricularia reniformis TaxID=192314 RepID=A0A1Y0AZS7_9LAMI|nr:hypothetical protein AEK19_MT0378 [Utricularia reniformis]ART30650.1 hypothetical protein AEK19_MT0378 [Utricularia reniformis]